MKGPRVIISTLSLDRKVLAIPYLQCVVAIAMRAQQLIRSAAESQTANLAPSLARHQLLKALGIPQSDCFIKVATACSQHIIPVGVPSQCSHRRLVTFEHSRGDRQALQIPNLDKLVTAAGSQLGPVWRPFQGTNILNVSLNLRDNRVPQTSIVVQNPAVLSASA